MAVFYLTAAFDPAGLPPPVAAVLLQALQDGEPAGPAPLLAEWEWGEREVLRYLVDRGLFDPSDAFVPAGPRVRTTLAQLAERLPRARLRQWSAGELEGFLARKRMEEWPPPSPALPEALDSLFVKGDYRGVLQALENERAALLGPLRILPEDPAHRKPG